MGIKGHKQVAWTAAMDEALLVEGISHNPFHAKFSKVMETWSLVAAGVSSLGAEVTRRACKEQIELLLEQHVAHRRRQEAASGVVETVSRRDELLEEISELRRDADEQKDMKRKRETESKATLDAVGATLCSNAELRVAHG